MDVSTFAEIKVEFMARVSAAIYCSMTTVDHRNRPRSRMMHPIWDDVISWVISWPQSHKAKHLEHNPYVSLAYIQDKDKPVYVDCVAEWMNSESDKQHVWVLHQTIAPPLGFDPQPHYGSIHNQYYGVLKFTPWRIELANLGGEPLVWRKSR